VARILGECPPTAETGQLLTELSTARAELGEFAQGIRPPALDSGGLAAALPLLAQRAITPIELVLDVDRLDPAVEAALYFFCSEALANIAKHAQARRVSMAVTREGALVVVTVIDDGVGGADPNGLGLRGLADRIEALGGRMSVADASGGGTVLAAGIPAVSQQPLDAR
jgi:signal transduction histidine kinase